MGCFEHGTCFLFIPFQPVPSHVDGLTELTPSFPQATDPSSQIRDLNASCNQHISARLRPGEAPDWLRLLRSSGKNNVQGQKPWASQDCISHRIASPNSRQVTDWPNRTPEHPISIPATNLFFLLLLRQPERLRPAWPRPPPLPPRRTAGCVYRLVRHPLGPGFGAANWVYHHDGFTDKLLQATIRTALARSRVWRLSLVG